MPSVGSSNTSSGNSYLSSSIGKFSFISGNTKKSANRYMTSSSYSNNKSAFTLKTEGRAGCTRWSVE